MEEYTKKVMEHFMNPHNVGEIPNADGIGNVSNPVCGDILRLYIKVEDEKIKDVKFRTFGCAAAIASSSILTDLIKGKSIKEALKISNKTVVDALDGLPQPKIHCSLLAEDGLKSAIEDCLKRKGISIKEFLNSR